MIYLHAFYTFASPFLAICLKHEGLATRAFLSWSRCLRFLWCLITFENVNPRYKLLRRIIFVQNPKIQYFERFSVISIFSLSFRFTKNLYLQFFLSTFCTYHEKSGLALLEPEFRSNKYNEFYRVAKNQDRHPQEEKGRISYLWRTTPKSKLSKTLGEHDRLVIGDAVVVYLPRRATREQRANRSRRRLEDYKCGVDPGRFRVTWALQIIWSESTDGQSTPWTWWPDRG